MSQNKIIEGMRQAVAYAKGETVDVRETLVTVPQSVDVKAIRESLGFTQAEFARKFGFSAGSVRNWEQGRRQPEGPARLLLKVIEVNPDAVFMALSR